MGSDSSTEYHKNSVHVYMQSFISLEQESFIKKKCGYNYMLGIFLMIDSLINGTRDISLFLIYTNNCHYVNFIVIGSTSHINLRPVRDRTN